MGLLDYIGQKAREIPENAKAAYRGLLAAPEELAALFSPGMLKGVNQAMNTPATLDRDKAVGMAMDYLQTTPAGLLGHIVYHGSPHKFSKFDMSKIGTGEGAQAYGHGLYFAESPEVAADYARKLSNGSAPLNFDGLLPKSGPYGPKSTDLGDFNSMLRDNLNLSNTDADAVTEIIAGEFKTVDDAINSFMQSAKRSDNEPWRKEYYEEISESAKRLKDRFKNVDNRNFYKVDIPDEAIPRMLDWDKPLSEQNIPDSVFAALPVDPRKVSWMKADGKTLIEGLQNAAGKEQAQQILQQAGIPGIRYLDGSSRTAGQGTSNFVLFDDQLPRILEVNGQPTGLLSYADEAAQKPKPKKAK